MCECADRKNDILSPLISVVLPVYNSETTLSEALSSIESQTFSDWECLIICEPDCEDNSVEVARSFEVRDPRFRVIINEKRSGLPASLNTGIRLAKGRYIARMDADDISLPERFAIQFDYMESHNADICQSYQRYFGRYAYGYVHTPDTYPKRMKARLLFHNDVCHSTVMMRKDFLVSNNLYYDENSVVEDYELWCRAVKFTDICTIPQILGEYRADTQSITLRKKVVIQKEMEQITAEQLRANLNISVSDDETEVLGGHYNKVYLMAPDERAQALDILRPVLLRIWEANRTKHFYDDKALLEVLASRWRWAKYDGPWKGDIKVKNITEALELPSIGGTIKRMVLLPLKLIQLANLHLHARSIEHLSCLLRNEMRAQTAALNIRMDELERKLEKME